MLLGGKKKKPEKAGVLRRGQLITTFGVGAIVDLPRESVIIAGTDFWKNDDDDDEKYKIHENNLQKFLQVDYFVTPPGAKDEYGNPTGKGVPAFRFPTWMFCPKCKRLAPAKRFAFTKHPRCERCKVPLVPSRFVVACENGHLDDFPYEWWVHYGGRCKKKKNPDLSIEMNEKKSGLDGIEIKCKSCGSKRTMAGSFGKDALKGFKCTRKRPWLRDTESGECDQPMRTMQRGATNLHFGVTVSALSIPPWSKNIMLKINNKWDTLKYFMKDKDKEIFTRIVSNLQLPEQLGCTVDDIWEHAQLKQKNDDECDSKSWQDILEGEYRAFMAGSTDEEGEFKTKKVAVPPIAEGYVDEVVLALRLREVMALRGFTRIRSDFNIEDKDTFVKLSQDFKNWLPGIELKGEGFFVSLNKERLKQWENNENVIARYKHLNEKGVISKRQTITPRYVLLHTLAHLLIRQLTLQCGYAGASLKERIYCSFTESEKFKDMAGILIYTSANDSEGSLGGLVREGLTDRLDNTFRQMLEASSWCSSDPLCINSKGQGTGATNLAACHACTLLPETSCEICNCYLDRAAVVGTFDDKMLGYFGPLVAGESERR